MNRIAELRKAKNITQLEFCAILNVAQPTLSGWEIGRRQADYINLKKMSEFFNVSIDYLLGFTDNPNPPEEKKPITQPLPYPPKILQLAEQISKLPPDMRELIEKQLKIFAKIDE